jgi:uncharacterized protein (DUF302 family)
MSYYISKTLTDRSFQEVIEHVTEALKEEGFGILTEIDMQATMKKKMEVEIRPYRILGACNAPYAYRALQAENKIGTMLPCNVIVQELEGGAVEVAAVDPVASMQAVKNEVLGAAAREIKTKLERVVAAV